MGTTQLSTTLLACSAPQRLSHLETANSIHTEHPSRQARSVSPALEADLFFCCWKNGTLTPTPTHNAGLRTSTERVQSASAISRTRCSSPACRVAEHSVEAKLCGDKDFYSSIKLNRLSAHLAINKYSPKELSSALKSPNVSSK
jgi:hypothetical protein